MTSGDPSFEIRPLATEREFTACLDLQRATWGSDFRELVPAALLQVTQKVGGVAAGAFDDSGELLGFVYGITGIHRGMPTHWSHMLAVRETLRGRGIGRALKHYQRDVVSDLGVQSIFWTFDPLVARNGHLNLMRLGAVVTEYVSNMYGDTSMSKTDSVIGTDRFVVRWEITKDALCRTEGPGTWEDAPIVTAPASSSDAVPTGDPSLPDVATVRVEVPHDIQQLKQRFPDAAAAWRRTTRRALEHYLARSFRVRALVRDIETGRYFYIVDRA